MPKESKRLYPKRGTVYTLREILDDLYLRDMPFLRFYPTPDAVELEVLQNEFLFSEEYSEEACETRWRYERETEEWIPLFVAEDSAAILHLIEQYEPMEDEPENLLWRMKKPQTSPVAAE